MTFFEHLVELRKRIINSLISVGVGAMVGWYVAPHFVDWITKPMLKALKEAGLAQQLVYTHPAGYLNLLITLSIYLGLVLASPIVLYQIWLFVAPRFTNTNAAPSLDFSFLPSSYSWAASPSGTSSCCPISCGFSCISARRGRWCR